MVEARCLFALLLVSFLALSRVSAFHPVARSMARGEPESDSDSPSQESNDLAAYEGAFPLNEIEDNFLRTDGEAQKRGQNRNFLRFGKSSNPMASALYVPTESEEEKRASRNFLRFGRNPQRNFLRFGKSTPLQFGMGVEPDSSEELMKRESDKNFLRFGKAANRNFLRFGRSTESQMKDNCENCLPAEPQSTSDLTESTSTSHKRGNALSKRSKRSVSAFYDDAEFLPHQALTWASQYGNMLPQSVLSDSFRSGDQTSNGQKRGHSRSFLRYGRDPLDLHFLRFGKRVSTEDEKAPSEVDDDSFNRYVRARSDNSFLRFG